MGWFVKEYLIRGAKAEALARAIIHPVSDSLDLAKAQMRTTGAFRDVLANEADGVLASATLIRAPWVGKVHRAPKGPSDAPVPGELDAVVEGNALRGQPSERVNGAVGDRIGEAAKDFWPTDNQIAAGALDQSEQPVHVTA